MIGDGLLLQYGYMNLDQNKGASSTYSGLTFAPGTFVHLCFISKIE